MTENMKKWYLRFVSDATFYLTQRSVRNSDTLICGCTWPLIFLDTSVDDQYELTPGSSACSSW